MRPPESERFAARADLVVRLLELVTNTELILMATIYAVAFVIVTAATRAGAVRTLGALVGGLAAAVFVLGAHD